MLARAASCRKAGESDIVGPRGDRTRCARRRRVGERGTTLIELLVTIVIIAIAVVGIVGGLSAAENIARVDQDQAQLEVAMRQLTDFVRDSNSTSGLPYTQCAPVKTYNDYINGVSGVSPPHLPTPAGVTSWGVATSGIYESISGKRTSASGAMATTSPLMKCAGSSSSCAAATPCDWGVQEIVLTVSSGSRSLTRTVWKSNSW